jgi:hypothetical protein
MGAWANQTIAQSTFLGWMSNADGFNYFVNTVLPDIIANGAKVENPDDSNLPHIADLNTILLATGSAGSNLGLSIPQSVLETAANPPKPAPVATVAAPTVTDGKAALKAELDAWGLGGLTDMAWNMQAQGLSGDAITAAIRGTDEWKSRFSGIVQRQKAGLPAGSESDALAYEQSMHEMLHQYGITGYTQQDYQKWYGGDTSVAEMSTRAQAAAKEAYSTAPEALAAVQRLYGINAGDLTHYILDTDHALPQIQQKLDAGAIAGSAAAAGVGQLTAQQAQLIGQYTDPTNAAGALQKIGGQEGLYRGLPGEGGDFSIDDLIKGYFGGDQATLNAIRMRNQQRDFSQAGGAVNQSSKGAIGAGAIQSS